jgi:Fe-S-cluster containining protein
VEISLPRRASRGGLSQERDVPKAAFVYHKGKNVVTPRVSASVGDESYKTILERADQHFASVLQSQSRNLQCGAGCSLCCYGLFEIGSGDVPVIAEGLEKLHPARRRKIIRKALEIVASTAHPNLRECDAEEKEAFFDRAQAIACPNLGEDGLCQMYEHRPLVCRTFGLPLKEGRTYIGDICELNFTKASRKEKVAAAWDLEWEDVLGSEDEFTIPEVIVLVSRMRGWLPREA